MVEASGAAVAYLGIDVGKLSHSACAIDAGGEVVFRADLENRPDDIDRLLERAGASALVVVDQRRNIGALVLARAFESTPIPLTPFTPPSGGLRLWASWPLRTRRG